MSANESVIYVNMISGKAEAIREGTTRGRRILMRFCKEASEVMGKRTKTSHQFQTTKSRGRKILIVRDILNMLLKRYLIEGKVWFSMKIWKDKLRVNMKSQKFLGEMQNMVKEFKNLLFSSFLFFIF
ncbi:unnamed protein product [Camellia sinensis]